MNRNRFYMGAVRAVALTAALLAAGHAAWADAPPATAQDWQAMARADLDATHALVLSAHPGSIDELNPAFREWSETGYRKAQALIPRVISYDSAMSAVRYYVAGFRDGHFVYSDNARAGYPIYINGWNVERVGADYIVRQNWKNWATPLPPIGARLIQCDGRQPDAIVREDVMPYFDARDLPAVLDAAAQNMTTLKLSDLTLKRCSFKTEAGATLDLEVSYHAVTTDEYFDVAAGGSRRAAHPNAYTYKDGVLWISAGNFSLRPGTADAAELEALLAALPKLEGVRQIVFDTRGNGGGDSGVGDRIFNAATGGFEIPDKDVIAQLPHTYAEWRVSDVSINTTNYAVEHKTQLYGAQDDGVRWLQGFARRLAEARAEGRQWVRQDGGYRISAADFARAHGHLRRFDGQVALLTDEHCASACLDFADLALRTPGAVHLGQTTSYDSLYLEVGSARLPSGNQLFLPMKVWRNRVRGNNQALVPDLPLAVDMRDDDAVHAATLAALKSDQKPASTHLDQGH